MTISNIEEFANIKDRIDLDKCENNVIEGKFFDLSSSPHIESFIQRMENKNKATIFIDCVFSNLNLKNKIINGSVSFKHCLFKGGQTTFENTIFRTYVTFNDSFFNDTINFNDTQFNENAFFRNIQTSGEKGSRFLFGQDPSKVVKKTIFYPHILDFTYAKFGNEVIFNYRHFVHRVYFIGTEFTKYFSFAHVDLGIWAIFHNVRYSNVQYLESDPSLERSRLINCFDLFIDALKKVPSSYAEHIQEIRDSLLKKVEGYTAPLIPETGNDDLSVDAILAHTHWNKNTLSKYASDYPKFFLKKGTGKSRTYSWRKIQEFSNLSPKEREKYKRKDKKRERSRSIS